MSYLIFILVPLFAWFIAGSTKFLVNTISEKRLAFDLIGYGGMPSTHSSVVSSACYFVFLVEGIKSPAFVVAITLAFIVFLDASSLRKQVGKQAEHINRLAKASTEDLEPLRERMGHTPSQILAGVIVGCISAHVLYLLSPILNF